MRLGALLGPIDPNNPQAIAEQACQLEKEGYDSLWAAQVTGPAFLCLGAWESYDELWAAQTVSRGRLLTDPFIALHIAAAATDKVTLGTAILQLPIYSPTVVADKAHLLMQASANRFLLGLGTGSAESDHVAHDSDYASRLQTFNQHLADLRRLFATGEAGSQHSAHREAVTSGPPLLYDTWGGEVARAASEFDGWIASGMHRAPDDFADVLAAFRKSGGSRAIVSNLLITAEQTLDDIAALLHCYEHLGFDDAVVMFLPGSVKSAEVRCLLAN